MIEEASGDLLTADVDALVNPVNCEGVMGRGLARQFKDAFPDNYASYRAACTRGDVVAGRMWIVDRGDRKPRWIVNFPTKRSFRNKSRLDDIEAGLTALVEHVRRLAIRSIAVPALGCGLGGLDWHDVRPRIERAFTGLDDVCVKLFVPALGLG